MTLEIEQAALEEITTNCQKKEIQIAKKIKTLTRKQKSNSETTLQDGDVHTDGSVKPIIIECVSSIKLLFKINGEKWL